jgi:hypothetical protein
LRQVGRTRFGDGQLRLLEPALGRAHIRMSLEHDLQLLLQRRGLRRRGQRQRHGGAYCEMTVQSATLSPAGGPPRKPSGNPLSPPPLIRSI